MDPVIVIWVAGTKAAVLMMKKFSRKQSNKILLRLSIKKVRKLRNDPTNEK